MLLKKPRNSILMLAMVALAALTLASAAHAGPQGAFNPAQQQAAFGTNPTVATTPALPGITDQTFISGGNFAACQATVGGYTKAIVACIRNTIVNAAYQQLGWLSVYVARTVAVCCTLAILLWGTMILSGKASALTKEGYILAIKIGAVAMMTWNFGSNFANGQGAFPMALAAMEDMLTLVSGYVQNSNTLNCTAMPGWAGDSGTQWIVWDSVDCLLQTLIGGIFSLCNIATGIAGFLIACAFSAAPGIFIAGMGIVLIIQLLFAVLRAVYIFLLAYIGFTLMVLVSPFFIPLILFGPTRAFFDKWLKATFGFMLQPMFVFAYLGMGVAGYDTVIVTGTDNLQSVYEAISGISIGSGMAGPCNLDIGPWLINKNAYEQQVLGQKAVALDSKTASARLLGAETNSGALSDISAALSSSATAMQQQLNTITGFNIGDSVTGVSWGQLAVAAGYGTDPTDTATITKYIVNLFLSFMMALLTGYVFLKMLDFLPFIGSGISSESLALPTLGVGKMGPPGEQGLETLKDKFAARFGGGG